MNTAYFGSKRPRTSTRRHATSSGLISADGIAINASRLADLMRSASAALSLPRPSCQLPSARVNAIPAAAASVGHSDGLKRKFDIAGKQLAPRLHSNLLRIANENHRHPVHRHDPRQPWLGALFHGQGQGRVRAHRQSADVARGAVGHAVRIADAGFSLWHYHDQALRKKK